MKRLLATLTMLALFSGILLAQSQDRTVNSRKPATPRNTAMDELKQIERDWADASKTKNAEELGKILADGWIGLESDGTRKDKAKALADLKSSENSTDTIEIGPMTVRIFGNTAVVTGSSMEKSKENGKDTSAKYVWTDVFVRHNGKWRAVASQSTKVPSVDSRQ